MKREILFRGKRVDNGEWIEGDLMQNYIHHEGYLTIVQGGCIYYKIIPETIGQFTGKTLIKGDKVFEGTIAFHEEEQEDGTDQRTYLVCVWIEEWSQFVWLTTGEYIKYQDMGAESLDESMFWSYNLNESKEYHLAGNIHDNPELLK